MNRFGEDDDDDEEEEEEEIEERKKNTGQCVLKIYHLRK